MKHSLGAWLGALALAAAAGFGFTALHTPIPWLIGPLFAVGVGRVAGLSIVAPPGARQFGQWIVGTGLALYFTPDVIARVAELAPLMLFAALAAVAVGQASGRLLARLGGVDRTTAFFGSVPGGAAEMSVLAERYGARVDRVAVAQSLRIVLVVVTVPALYALLQVHGLDLYAPAATEVSVMGLLELLAATCAGALVCQHLRIPNAWMLGALLVGVPLTAFDLHWSAMPGGLSAAAQLMIGVALGSRFERDLLSSAPRFLGAIVASVALGMALSAGLGLGLAWASGVYPATMLLATAPGGIAEMCITAKVLQLGVPIVTAFHVARVVILVACTAPLFRYFRRMRARAGD